MCLDDLVKALELTVFTEETDLTAQVEGGYTSDLMSDVIAHAQAGHIWITLQVHLNVVAVASMKEIPGVIFVGGRQPAEEVTNKADEEGVVLLGTELPAFEISGKLYSLGIRGCTPT